MLRVRRDYCGTVAARTRRDGEDRTSTALFHSTLSLCSLLTSRLISMHGPVTLLEIRTTLMHAPPTPTTPFVSITHPSFLRRAAPYRKPHQSGQCNPPALARSSPGPEGLSLRAPLQTSSQNHDDPGHAAVFRQIETPSTMSRIFSRVLPGAPLLREKIRASSAAGTNVGAAPCARHQRLCLRW